MLLEDGFSPDPNSINICFNWSHS
uniref:Uncharacterized protein n=1 Tax=Anguilla anguilla TaxID=7936 RepID=A0A0E9U6V4_ANGAN